MEDKKIDKLYELLENGNLDNETSAALRWAIFELESIYTEQHFQNGASFNAEKGL